MLWCTNDFAAMATAAVLRAEGGVVLQPRGHPPRGAEKEALRVAAWRRELRDHRDLRPIIIVIQNEALRSIICRGLISDMD